MQVQFEEINAQLGQRAPWLRGLTGYDPPAIDGWTTIRFHVGQLPIVFVTGGLSSDFARVADLTLLLQAGEQLTFRDDFMDHLVVTADGAPLRCHPFPDVTERVFALTELRLTCEAVARDAVITMRVDETLRVTGDRALYDVAGHSPPTWTFLASEPPQGDGVPGDALFEAP
ncbi:MAG: hypothetical protein J0L92_26650 [Deltaproteobacteria bacterium]|nr:hypothetical protein [Deltaproteobacteria bacterium]